MEVEEGWFTKGKQVTGIQKQRMSCHRVTGRQKQKMFSEKVVSLPVLMEEKTQINESQMG